MGCWNHGRDLDTIGWRDCAKTPGIPLPARPV